MHSVRIVCLMVVFGLTSTSAGCAADGGAAPPTSAPGVTSTASTSTAPAGTTLAPTPTAPTIPPASDDYGTCRVMGPSADGWEIVLDLEPAIGPGTYLVDYALRDDTGTILETVTREIGMHANEVLSYWDSLESAVTDVESCDIRRIEKDQEVCVAGRGCTLGA